jgi:hypothetical protein
MRLRRHTLFGRKLILAAATAAIAAPAAAAGTDTGIGIPAGRDAVAPAHELISENGKGQNSTGQPVRVVAASDEFDWADAGIGLGAGAAFALLMATGAVYASRRERPLAQH